MTRLTRRALLAVGSTASVFGPYVRRGYAAEALRVGSLSDLNSTYAILSGSGAVAAVRLAAADFMKEHPDIPVEVLVSDFQLKSDLGLGIAVKCDDGAGRIIGGRTPVAARRCGGVPAPCPGQKITPNTA